MKKGFTLVEMLTVISLIAVISLLIARPVTNVLKKVDKKACDAQNDDVLTAAKLYLTNNKVDINLEIGSTYPVTINTLINSGYLPEEMTNVITEDPIDKNIKVFIERENRDYYTYELERKICEY